MKDYPILLKNNQLFNYLTYFIKRIKSPESVKNPYRAGAGKSPLPQARRCQQLTLSTCGLWGKRSSGVTCISS